MTRPTYPPGYPARPRPRAARGARYQHERRPGWERHTTSMPVYRTPDDGYRVLPPPVGSLMAVPLVVGSLVAVTLGVYGGLNEPTGIAVNVAGFSSPLAAKAWLTTGAVAFAVIQVISAWVMYDRVPGIPPPRWIGGLHRWSGRIAFLLAVPVAVHCLYALGFVTDSPRALIHSLLGTLFFGAFATKMLGLRKDGLPGWVLPVLGGVAFTLLVGLWLSSSLWYFVTFGVQR